MSNQLSIPYKNTNPIPIKQAVNDYLRTYHADVHPEAFKWDVSVWEKLRQATVGGVANTNRVQAALTYHAQLVFILTKFPTNIGLEVPYSHAFDTKSPLLSLPSLAYERASLLFNLAASFSQLALSEDRSHGEGIKRANAHYQSAAGTLSYLITTALPQLSTSLAPSDIPAELTEPVLRALEFLMLAQAQECAWQRAIMDHLKNGVISKLSAKAASLYRASLKSIQDSSSVIKRALPPEWIAHIEAKQYHFQAAAHYRKSMEELESNRYGHELAHLLEADSLSKKSLDFGRRKMISKPVLDDIRSLSDALQKNLQRAERDNDLIYHQDVPSISSLPALMEISLVKSAVANSLQDPKTAVGEDGVLFKDLVAWGARVAIEIYQDRRENWLKVEIYDRAKELDDAASQALHSLNLPAALEALDRPIGLPPSLLKKAEEFRREDGLARIETSFENVEALAARTHSILEQAMDLLDQEASEDETSRQQNTRETWERLPSHEANRELTSKDKRYRQVLSHAAESDAHVREKWSEWEDSIVRLSWSRAQLEEWVPSSTTSSSKSPLINSESRNYARALRGQLETLDGIKYNRDQLARRVRTVAEGDDIQMRILREASGIEQWREVEPAMFEATLDDELNKYEKFKSGLEEGATKQLELLDEIRNTNSGFLQSRHDDPAVKARERALQSLDLAYHKYKEIMRNLEEGLKFYNGLQSILTGFHEACKQWVRSRRDETRAITESFSSLSFGYEQGVTKPEETHQKVDLVTGKTVSAPGVGPDMSSITKGRSSGTFLPPPGSDQWESTPVIFSKAGRTDK